MAILTTAVAPDLDTVFLDVPKLATTVALLLFLMVTITRQVAWSAAGVAALFSFSLRVHTVFGDVTPSPAVVADVLEKVAVLGVVTNFTAAVTDVRLGGGTALQTSSSASRSSPSTSSFGALPGPVARASALEAFCPAHGCGEIFKGAGPLTAATEAPRQLPLGWLRWKMAALPRGPL